MLTLTALARTLRVPSRSHHQQDSAGVADQQRLDEYSRRGHRSVDGWLTLGAIALIEEGDTIVISDTSRFQDAKSILLRN